MVKGKFKLDHFGIVTNDIEESKKAYSVLGFTASDTVIEDIQQVKICFLHNEDGVVLELVEPLNELSSVNKMLEKNGVTPYHTCYEVDDMDEGYDYLVGNGFIPLFIPGESPAMDNRRICYFYNSKSGFVELVEGQK